MQDFEGKIVLSADNQLAYSASHCCLEDDFGGEGAELCTAAGKFYRPLLADGMEMNTVISEHPQNATWFAVRTRSRQEKVAASMLEAFGVPNYLPLKTEVHRWSDRKQTVVTPLFKGYLFVRLNQQRDSRLQILKTPGVSGLVGNQSGPLPIPDCEIESIRLVLGQKMECSTYPYFTVGERVRVVQGPLAGVEGTLVRTQEDSKLVISVEMIQQSIAINIHASDISSAENPSYN